MPAEALRNARKNKADEFYTQLPDIEAEVKHYKEQLAGKIIFCNCDDPYESNFFKYFAMNFNFLGLKKLIATCFDPSPIAHTQLSLFGEEKPVPNKNRRAYKIEITEIEDYNGDGAVDLSDIEWLLKNKKNTLSLLKGNGDFRSEECVKLLKEADIVVTNPPFSLNVMYWVKNGDGSFEVLDGQQRTISFCQYVAGDFSVGSRYFHNLTKAEQDRILNYKVLVYFCEGDEDEKLSWFKIINIAGEKLTEQELRNATYTGPWLTHAKSIFSKSGCAAYRLAKDYVNGSPIRQEILETALDWIGKSLHLGEGQREPDAHIRSYMAEHQHAPNANELWTYFRDVIEWAKLTFPHYRKEMKGINWGALYDEFHMQTFDTAALEQKITVLMADDDVTNKKGVYLYVLTGREKYLNIRAFTENQKRQAYERQGGNCPYCVQEHRKKTHFEITEMEGDHITPWCEGGKTVPENCQMLCKEHNRVKSNK